MCGIAGFISNDISGVPLSTCGIMRDSIRYRGLDHQDEWTNGKTARLFHSRLSIIDLSTGNQPMWDHQGRFVIVFNGEIYNYKELRDTYRSLGATFRTESDTEVILEGFKLFGPKVFATLNGMFAIAIWDTASHTLTLARDHLGKKPLFYSLINGQLFFASTLDAFLGAPGWTGKLSMPSIYQFLLLGANLSEGTIYEQAWSVPRASYLEASVDRIQPRITQYWDVSFDAKSRAGFSEQINEYEALLTDSVRIRLRSDVPIAHTFSGGVDSGTIAAIATNNLQTPLSCFTIDFHTEEDPSEETMIAKQVAAALKLNWTHIQFDYHQNLLADLPAAYRFYDEPSPQLPLVYAYKLYQTIKPHATVVLSGNGADELLTGYIGDERVRRRDLVLRAIRWSRPLISAASGMTRRIQALAENQQIRTLSLLQYDVTTMFEESSRQRLTTLMGRSPEVEQAMEAIHAFTHKAKEAGVSSLLDLNMYAAVHYHTRDSNYRLPDISGLAAQVEVRSPYLDFRFVEFAARLPHRYKVGRLLDASANKFIAKHYYERHLGKSIAWARKKGMGWNLRWDKSIANDPAYLRAFSESFDILETLPGPMGAARSEWLRFRSNQPNRASLMMHGFMLGQWLKLRPGKFLV